VPIARSDAVDVVVISGTSCSWWLMSTVSVPLARLCPGTSWRR
jgi:hypothetical protein